MRPRARFVHAGDGADERGLAGAVGADNGDDGALLDVERNAVERLGVAVEHVEVFDPEHDHGFIRLRMILSENRFPLFGIMR